MNVRDNKKSTHCDIINKVFTVNICQYMLMKKTCGFIVGHTCITDVSLEITCRTHCRYTPGMSSPNLLTCALLLAGNNI